MTVWTAVYPRDNLKVTVRHYNLHNRDTRNK
uniref:Uncharacterized protein n=1 Tax=Rhizophora mucronata TaxID=61149 RepID=A0A2P2QJ27_RHIMU